MEIGQRLAVIEPPAFGHEGFDQAQQPVGAVGEAAQRLVRIETLLLTAFVEPAFGAGRVFGRRQPGEGQEIAGLEMRACFLEIGLALGIDQRRRGVGKMAVGIAVGGMALRFDEDRPAGAEAAEGVVEAARDRDQLGRDGGIEIGAAKARRALEAAVFVEHDARADQRRPRQEVGKPGVLVAIFGEIHHRRSPAQTVRCAGMRR